MDTYDRPLQVLETALPFCGSVLELSPGNTLSLKSGRIISVLTRQLCNCFTDFLEVEIELALTKCFHRLHFDICLTVICLNLSSSWIRNVFTNLANSSATRTAITSTPSYAEKIVVGLI